MSSYKIVRYFQRDSNATETIVRGLTLEQAQAHCQDPETSSSTATSPEAEERTRDKGPWFDGYREESAHERPRSFMEKALHAYNWSRG